jgi:hypothetical protein
MEAILQQQSFWIAVIIGVFAIVAIFAVRRYQSGIKLAIKAKGAEMNIEGNNPAPQSPPTSTVKGVKSRSGGFTYDDTTGQGSDIQDVETETDVTITRSPGDDAPSKK